jgi:hypothetical protein
MVVLDKITHHFKQTRLTRDQLGTAHELLLQTPQGQHSMALPVL